MNKIEVELFCPITFIFSQKENWSCVRVCVCWKQGKILFGILLRYERWEDVGEDNDLWLQVGQGLHPN